MEQQFLRELNRVGEEEQQQPHYRTLDRFVSQVEKLLKGVPVSL